MARLPRKYRLSDFSENEEVYDYANISKSRNSSFPEGEAFRPKKARLKLKIAIPFRLTELFFFLVSYVMCLFFSLNATFNRMAVCHYFEHITCARDLKNKPVNSDHGSRTSCFCFPTKMLHLNAPLFPLKCSVSPKNVTEMVDDDYHVAAILSILMNTNQLTKNLNSNVYKQEP